MRKPKWNEIKNGNINNIWKVTKSSLIINGKYGKFLSELISQLIILII